MNVDTIIGIILAAVAVLGAIGSVLALAFKVGTLTGIITAFMASSERDRENLHAEATRQADRLSMHMEHHSKGVS